MNIHIYIYLTPNLGLVIAVVVRDREQGRYSREPHGGRRSTYLVTWWGWGLIVSVLLPARIAVHAALTAYQVPSAKR